MDTAAARFVLSAAMLVPESGLQSKFCLV
jgi:hypothetical protein